MSSIILYFEFNSSEKKYNTTKFVIRDDDFSSIKIEIYHEPYCLQYKLKVVKSQFQFNIFIKKL